MAGKVNVQKNTSYAGHPKRKRPGVHAKSRHSSLKTSKHYVKAYRGQGK